MSDARGLQDRVEIIEADMGNLPWPAASLDLLWSEGAAYLLTFEGALRAWRPLLATGGCAVISELSWFVDDPPAPAADPAMSRVIAETEAEMALFERHHDAYGYTFYLLEAR